MAGRVRQPIDEKAFSKFLAENVPEIKTPIELKQVRWAPNGSQVLDGDASATEAGATR